MSDNVDNTKKLDPASAMLGQIVGGLIADMIRKEVQK